MKISLLFLFCIFSCSEWKNVKDVDGRVSRSIAVVCDAFVLRNYDKLFDFLAEEYKSATDKNSFMEVYKNFDSLSYVMKCHDIKSIKTDDKFYKVEIYVEQNMHANTNSVLDERWDLPLEERRYLDTTLFTWFFLKDKDVNWVGFEGM